MSDIINFFSGGFLEIVVRFFTNAAQSFAAPLVNKINALLPNIDEIAFTIADVFDYALPYCKYILDFSLISPVILSYLVYSLIFRILIKNNTYIVKFLLNWYKKLVP